MRLYDRPTLEELSGWQYDEEDNPPVITEADMINEREFETYDGKPCLGCGNINTWVNLVEGDRVLVCPDCGIGED